MFNREITLPRLRQITPSVFATEPWEQVSENYKFISTEEILTRLMDNGFAVVWARQSRTRIEGKEDHTKHMLRLQLRSDLGRTTGEVPEIVMVNSSDRASAYKLYSGILRCACWNGLISMSTDTGHISVRHQGGRNFVEDITEASYKIIDNSQNALKEIEEWKGIQLSDPEVISYAETVAKEVVKNENLVPQSLLRVERSEDRPNHLWNVMNRVQEHVIQGGGKTVNPKSGRPRKTSSVKDVQKTLNLNTALWTFTQAVAKYKRDEVSS